MSWAEFKAPQGLKRPAPEPGAIASWPGEGPEGPKPDIGPAPRHTGSNLVAVLPPVRPEQDLEAFQS